MDRGEFHRFFKASGGPAVLPVVHVLEDEQTKRNVRLAISEGAHGVFLINHNFSYFQLLPIIESVRKDFPYLWLGVNFLGVTGKGAFRVLGDLGTIVDGYWADNACIDESAGPEEQFRAQAIDKARRESGWSGLYFGGTAFKGQRSVQDGDCAKAASLASRFMDVVTTSGQATGQAARLKKVAELRKGCGVGEEGVAMALASGVTPENALEYTTLVDCFMVATGISPPNDFYNFDPDKLRALVHVSRSQTLSPLALSPSSSSSEAALCAVGSDGADYTDDTPWYLKLIAPNTKGEDFAWLDPSSIYLDAKAFASLTYQLSSQFDPNDVDLVAGVDAMGFPLAASMAYRMGKGFLALRRGGKLCVEVDQVEYMCYSGPGKVMEVRKNPFEPGTRVLIVDQWIETGGTMTGAVELVERNGGVVAGIATICRETKPCASKLCEKYKVVHVVPPKWQPFFDDHSFLATMLT